MQATKLPSAFLQRMKIQLGNEHDAFVESLQQPSPTSIRLNPFKPAGKFEHEEKVPWCEEGRYLNERPSFTFDPLFHAGCYYVQEASSMFIEQAWQQINSQNRPVRVLDLCAAPGGKSTHLLSLMTGDSLLVSNEIVPGRNKILRQNIVKWGTANCIVTQNEPKDFARLGEFFDIVLVDAPCSGEGLFRKDKDAVDEWSERNVQLCALRQSDILKQAAKCLKPSGFLIYSTCTFEQAENDEQVANSDLILANLSFPDYGQVATKCGYQFYPHKIKGEGFYLAVMKKAGEDTGHKTKDTRSKHKNQYAATYLADADQFIEFTKHDLVFALPQQLYSDFQFLEKYLYIRNAGIFMGTTKGKDFIPSHDLALSIHLKKDLPSLELTYDQAISYLRCESPRIETPMRGWCLASYQGQNMGWMKVLDGRINNYFPRDWRILKQD